MQSELTKNFPFLPLSSRHSTLERGHCLNRTRDRYDQGSVSLNASQKEWYSGESWQSTPSRETCSGELVLEDASVCTEFSPEFRSTWMTSRCPGPSLGFHCSPSFPPELAKRRPEWTKEAGLQWDTWRSTGSFWPMLACRKFRMMHFY